MDGDEEHVAVLPEMALSAISMVVIPVNDYHPAAAEDLELDRTTM